jgi:hypothetical protein
MQETNSDPRAVMHSLLVSVVLAICSSVAGQGSREVPWLLTNMVLELRVDYQNGTIRGTAALHLRNVNASVASNVPLLLNRLMAVSGITDMDGRAIPFGQDVVVFQDDSLLQVTAAVVRLHRPVAPGDSVAIVVRYGGRLVGYAETGSLYIRDHVDRDFTIIREDAFAFPTLGTPSRAAVRSLARAPFTFSAAVTVPVGLVVAIAGRALDKQTRDSLITWRYRSEAPVPFLNIAIAPYRTTDEGGVQIFYFPQDSSGASLVQQAIGGAIARYTEWYGPLSGSLRLTVVEIPEGWGSQASLTGGIIETADAFRSRTQLYQLYHELSHLWNVPDLDRPSPRWNEGLATFLQWRVAAELDGWSGWDTWLSRTEESLRARCESRPCATTPMVDYGRVGLTDASYPLGGLMFYLLHHALGSQLFDSTYREFFQRHRNQGARTSDFVATFAAVSPRAHRILSEWLLTTRWYARLAAGQSVRQILEEYAQ